MHANFQAVSTNMSIGCFSSILSTIHDSDKNIAIFERNISGLNNEIDVLLSRATEFRCKGTVQDISKRIKEAFCAQCPELHLDFIELIELFKDVTGAEEFKFFLHTVTTDMCRKFHTDINDLRMLCTYAGPGTLWVAEDDNSSKSQSQSSSHEVSIDKDSIHQVKTGNVAILKGALYPNSNPAIHRSPSISKNAETRLLLRIDTDETAKLWS